MTNPKAPTQTLANTPELDAAALETLRIFTKNRLRMARMLLKRRRRKSGQ